MSSHFEKTWSIVAKEMSKKVVLGDMVHFMKIKYLVHENAILASLKKLLLSYTSQVMYSEVPNYCTVPNKSIQDWNFWLLVHKIAIFWPFLAHSCHKINNRTGTIIRNRRVRSFWHISLQLPFHINFVNCLWGSVN